MRYDGAMAKAATLMSLLATAALASCGKAAPTTDTAGTAGRPPTATDIRVELAAVTLGNECGEGWTPPPPVVTAMAAPSVTAPADEAAPSSAVPASPPAKIARSQQESLDVPAEAEAPGVASRSRARYVCPQTSMQLSLTATAGAAATTVQVKRVELLDAQGTVIGELTARTPTAWKGDAYAPWDQVVAPGQQLAASYALSSPNWDAMEGGAWAQRGKTFQLRVIVSIGAREQTVDRQAITPTMLEPAVPT